MAHFSHSLVQFSVKRHVSSHCSPEEKEKAQMYCPKPLETLFKHISYFGFLAHYLTLFNDRNAGFMITTFALIWINTNSCVVFDLPIGTSTAQSMFIRIYYFYWRTSISMQNMFACDIGTTVCYHLVRFAPESTHWKKIYTRQLDEIPLLQFSFLIMLNLALFFRFICVEKKVVY